MSNSCLEQTFKFLHFFKKMYWLIWKAELQKGEGNGELFHTSPTPRWPGRNATDCHLSWTGSGWNQKPGAPSRSPTWVARLQILGPFSHWFPQTISKELNEQGNSQDTLGMPIVQVVALPALPLCQALLFVDNHQSYNQQVVFWNYNVGVQDINFLKGRLSHPPRPQA